MVLTVARRVMFKKVVICYRVNVLFSVQMTEFKILHFYLLWILTPTFYITVVL
jgi:hypothetical protein